MALNAYSRQKDRMANIMDQMTKIVSGDWYCLNYVVSKMGEELMNAGRIKQFLQTKTFPKAFPI